MDDKMIDKLDNIDEAAADQLLDSIGEYEAVDTGTADRIKTSVLGKAGIERKFKSPFIPNKLRFLVGSFAITIVELLFFTVFAFIAWMDGFLSYSGIDLGFRGVVPAALYVIMFVFMSLSLYLCMYHMDSSFSLKRVIPKNRTFLGYFLYFILSSAIKAGICILFVYIGEKVTDYIGFSFIDQLLVLVLFILIFSVADMFLSEFKNMIIIRFEGVSSSPFNWRINIRSFLMELLKYTVITGAVISFAFLGAKAIEFEISIASQFIASIFALWIINMFFSIVVLLKKRHYMKTTPWMIKGASVRETAGKEPQAEIGTRWVYVRQRAVAVGVLGAAFLYITCLAVPYVGKTALRNEKPPLISFSCKADAEKFLSNSELKLSLELNTDFMGINGLSKSLYVFNKMMSCAAFLNPDISLGMGNMKSEAFVDKSFDSGMAIAGVPVTTNKDGVSKTKYGYSKTNTQVENVDEADVIKTDGKYMYYLSQGKLSIVKANPPENMEIVQQIVFNEKGLFPEELFLYKEYLTVILTGGSNNIKTVVRTYNIKDPYKPKQERDLELYYSYLTARMVKNNIYLVSSALTHCYDYNLTALLPMYRDSAIGSQELEIDYKNLYFKCGNSNRNYSCMNVVAAFPVDDPRSKAQIKGYIGGYGENVYVSTKHVYIVESSEYVSINAPIKDFINNFSRTDSEGIDFRKCGTDIYRIDIQDGTIGGFDSAYVPGTVHNQFSMDEYNGYFRLTTQTGENDYASSNVYVLDENMKLCGSLEGLAPKESIYSSRFMGDRLYLVTFKKVDPLFVINLKDPRKPTVMGKLKIPGYSEYIHPLDENHIIGFGKDTAGGDESFSWNLGIRMAIFDVTDVKNPKEKFVETIGDRGTDSELLKNHKALMFMEELGVMAFPVSVAKVPEGSADSAYGSFVFQGAYVYNVSSREGFKLRGRITHQDQKNDKVPQRVGPGDGDYVNRIIYANESLYTFSKGKVKATRYSDMKEASEISLK